MKKRTIIWICIVVVFLVIFTVLWLLYCKKRNFSFWNWWNTNYISDENLHILPSIWNEWKELISDGNLHILTSIDDEILADSMRCWTFQLVWNDMVNNVVKQDVVFNPQLQMVENLNKQTFSNKYLSENSYFSKFGLLTLDLKAAIENWIKEKFNETSDILDQLDWSDVPQSDDYYDWKSEKRYGFYAMLKKIFNFENAFDELDKWNFNDKYNNIEYFWIKWSSSSDLYKQVYVYYYNSEDDFAVALKSKEWEDIILARWIWWDSFKDLFNNIESKGKDYLWKHYFTKNDYLKVPNLKVKTLTEFLDLENKLFLAADGDICNIEKALQTIEFELNKSGWYIKSEAVIGMMKTLWEPDTQPEHRYFYFDKPFVMFWKESDKDLPYFATQISDITLFQE